MRDDLREIRTSAISVRENVRQEARDIEDLAQSIRARGLLQPVVVRRCGEGYELVAGHRRLAACKRLGLARIRALIVDMPEVDRTIVQLIENTQRDDLSSYEVSLALERLCAARGWSQREAAKAIGKPHDWIARHFQYLAIIREVQAAGLKTKKLLDVPLSTVRKIASLATADKVELLRQTIAEDLSQLEVVERRQQYPRFAGYAGPNRPRPFEGGGTNKPTPGEQDTFTIEPAGGRLILRFAAARKYEQILALLQRHGGVLGEEAHVPGEAEAPTSKERAG